MSDTDKRFVIQKHTAVEGVHWDFMLECDDILQTYRLDKPPEKIVSEGANAVRIFDHPLKFLTYQGSVNKGRGEVCIVEAGTYQILQEEHSLIKLNINGQILKGTFVLGHGRDYDWILTYCSRK